MDNATEILEITNRACNAFRQKVGKHVVLRVRPVTDENPHLALAFRPKGGKADHTYIPQLVPLIDATAVAHLVKDWNPGTQGLALAQYIPADHAIKLKDAGIPFLDTAGNAYLAWPGFFVLITGCPPPVGLEIPRPPRMPRLFNPTGLQVLFVLLARPEYVNRPYRDIAEAAGVALGTVGWVMADMKGHGYFIDLGKEGKRLQQRPKLLAEWAGAYARQLYLRRNTRRFGAENTDWWKTTDLRQFNALWGGDVAGDRLTGYLKPGEITIYAKGIPGPLLQAQHMRADPTGEVTIVEMFWNFPPNGEEKDTVPPLLVYADLLATGDPRAIETAKMIHERYLARPDGQD